MTRNERNIIRTKLLEKQAREISDPELSASLLIAINRLYQIAHTCLEHNYEKERGHLTLIKTEKGKNDGNNHTEISS